MSTINQTAFSPKEFQFLIGGQSAYGTQLLNALYAVDVDSVGFPSFGTNAVMDVRAGGRVLRADDFFQTQNAQVTEISVSGTAKVAVMDLLLKNVTDDNSAPYNITAGYEPTSVGTGSTPTLGDMKLFTIVITSPVTNSDMVFKDCVVTSLNLTGDANAEGGRVKFSATFKTGSKPVSLSLTSEAVDTAIGTDDIFMSTWGDSDKRMIAGVNHVLVNTFSLTLENDAYFQGIDSNGNHEMIGRAPEFSVTCDFNVKYDSITEPFINTFQTQTGDSGRTKMASTDNVTSGSFGFDMPKSVFTNVAFAEGDSMALDLSMKAVASNTSTDDFFIIEV